MTNARDLDVHAALSPLPPSDAELAAWHSLSREEQVANYREALNHPDCDAISKATMADVLASARKRAAARRGG